MLRSDEGGPGVNAVLKSATLCPLGDRSLAPRDHGAFWPIVILLPGQPDDKHVARPPHVLVAKERREVLKSLLLPQSIELPEAGPEVYLALAVIDSIRIGGVRERQEAGAVALRTPNGTP